ncbi:MAG: protein-disulfide reductase DsbD family protein [Alphaproteobacteria bacterium]
MIALLKIIKHSTLALLAFIATSSTLSSTVHAQELLDRYTQNRLIVETNDLKAGETITVATEITLAPHWHVYWKNPGDSGLPVRINWTLPEGFEISDIKWPTPDKISYEILVNYGYYNRVTLLQDLKVPETLPAGDLEITANLEMLVCNEICIPESDTVSTKIKSDNIDNNIYITDAKQKLPKEITGNFNYSETDGTLKLALTPDQQDLFSEVNPNNIEFFPIEWGIIDYVEQPNVSVNGKDITLTHARSDRQLSELSKLEGVLVITSEKKGQNKGFSITATPKINKASISNDTPPTRISEEQTNQTQDETMSWFSAIFLAIMGGLILNLMPCVFPVLSIKALSLAKMRDKEKKHARQHGIAYTVGVILSFLIIGGIFVVLKETGSVIGWGFQLQNPIIVAGLAYLLFIIGLNLIGFFEFGGNFTNMGQKLTQGTSVRNSFFTGALATIVATPCTAPFMGAAMGYAATQSAFLSMSVFTALGFGLALPYLVLSYIPALQKILPKPGAWMNTFKQFLAFPMFASAIWLIWVVSQQAGSYGVLLVLLGMLSIAFCVWISHLHVNGGKKALTRTLLFLCLFLPFFSLFYIKTTEIDMQESSAEFEQEFSPEKLSELLQGDNPIFVEMTAAWCITCKVNHAIAIETQTTKNLFKNKNVSYLVGDWTNRNDTITKYLNKHGRNGVPLYVYYGPRNEKTGKRPQAHVLPQVITTSTLSDTIK